MPTRSAETLQPTALELAGGVILGLAADHSPADEPARSPENALEAAVLPAVRSSPCLVSFSGGVDSSLVLAAALRVARRHGLDLPVPVTWRFTDATRADEREWQERVIAELGVPDWDRIVVDDDLDLIGPHAQAVLRRHGVLYPPNRHFHAPLLERARGGALLAGVGGDQVLGLGRWRRAAQVLAGGRRPTMRDAAHVVLATAPTRARTRLDPMRESLRSPWLRPSAERQLALRHASGRAREPVWWNARAVWQRRRRDLKFQIASLELLAADAGARIVLPLVDGGFMAAVASAGGRRGFRNRREAVAVLLGDLAPRAALERRRKAIFDEGFWRSPSRALARDWSGDGVDPTLVDIPALQAQWRSETPPFRTSMLLQHVWLSKMTA